MWKTTEGNRVERWDVEGVDRELVMSGEGGLAVDSQEVERYGSVSSPYQHRMKSDEGEKKNVEWRVKGEVVEIHNFERVKIFF